MSKTWWVTVAVCVGCIPEYSVPNDSSYTDAGEDTGGDETTTTGDPVPAESTSTSTTSDAVDDTSTTEPSPFIFPPDGAVRPYECDFWEDECPRGEKCMPWSPGGGFSLDGTICAPIARDANAPGEPCTRIDGPNGIDDCEAHAMCWNVDPDTEMGVCVAFCGGTPALPTCADEVLWCTHLGENFPMLCLEHCDPVMQNCSDGTGCYPAHNSFLCLVDASEDGGAAGDACDYDRSCNPGLLCAAASVIPGCASPWGRGCCTPFCDTSIVPPFCPAGLDCVPWYGEGQAPPQYELVGVCMEEA